MSNQNRMKAKIKPNGRVELVLERRTAYGSLSERIVFTLTRRALEKALGEAGIEAPWKELVAKGLLR